MQKSYYYLVSLLVFPCAVFFCANSFAAGGIVEKEYKFTNFSGIETDANWNVKITHDSKYKVKVKSTEEEMNNLIVRNDGRTVSFSTKCQYSCPKNYAEISMPVLNKLETSGTAFVTIAGFNSSKIDQLNIKTSGKSRIALDDSIISELTMDCSGSTWFKGEQDKIDKLTLQSSGSSKVDLNESMVTDVNFDLSGSSKVSIQMAGGDMTGKMSGSSSVVYKGSVKNQNVEISGKGSIKQKD